MRKPTDLTQFLRFVEMCYEFWGSIVTLSPPPRPVVVTLELLPEGETGADGLLAEKGPLVK